MLSADSGRIVLIRPLPIVPPALTASYSPATGLRLSSGHGLLPTVTLDMSEMALGVAWDRVAHDYAHFISDHLERYAIDALRLAEVTAGEEVVDVATGPGTLAVVAARSTNTTALDHSREMIAALEKRATEAELARLTLSVGDGQALPFPDASLGERRVPRWCSFAICSRQRP